MKIINKIAIMAIVIMTTATIVFVACKKEEENVLQHKNNMYNNNIENIGIINNNALAYLYEECFNNVSNLRNTSFNTCNLFIKNCLQTYLNEYYNIDLQMSGQVLNEMNENEYAEEITLSDFTSGVDDEIYLTALTSIYNVFEGSIASYEELDLLLTDIEQSVVDTLCYENVRMACDICRYSYLYWKENYIDWCNLLSNPDNDSLCYTTGGWTAFKKIIKGDVQGALTGAGIGTSFAGIGAVAGALIGAPFGSGLAGIDIALDSAAARADRQAELNN